MRRFLTLICSYSLRLSSLFERSRAFFFFMLFKHMNIKYKPISGLYGKSVYLFTSFCISFILLPFFPIRCYVLWYSLYFLFGDQLNIRKYWNLGRTARSCLKCLQSLALIPAERCKRDSFQVIFKYSLCLQAPYKRQIVLREELVSFMLLF